MTTCENKTVLDNGSLYMTNFEKCMTQYKILKETLMHNLIGNLFQKKKSPISPVGLAKWVNKFCLKLGEYLWLSA